MNMDFRNLCQKIDVDSIRAKIPPMPAMPQLKLPKSIPKLKSRKIFRSSGEDVNRASTKQQHGMQQYPSMQQIPPPIPPADFINHTPTRISTISSLVHQSSQEHHQFDEGGGRTYRSACSINDDDYPSPTQYDRKHGEDSFRPDISPIRTSLHSLPKVNSPLNGSNANVKMSLTERLQKGYKDFSEFKIKHIFAKKTVVRKDNIEVDHYVLRYDEDRMRDQREQERQDREIADNYNFRYKISRQNTGHSESVSPSDSPIFAMKKVDRKAPPTIDRMRRSVEVQSDDESGIEASPPKRGVGIAKDVEKKEVKPTGYKERMRKITSYVSSHEESGTESNPEAGASGGGANVLSKLRGLGKRTTEEEVGTAGGTKRKAPLTPQQSDEKPEERSADNAMTSIKNNFRRLQKSMKRQPNSSVESDDDDDVIPREPLKPVTKTEKLTARLRRFKSRETSIDNLENESASPKKDDAKKSSPIRSAISNKLQTWKKSFKKQPTEQEATRTDDEEDESSPAKPQKRSDTLINKLKYIRSRKQPNSREDLDAPDAKDDEAKSKDNTTRKPSNLEEKFVQARQKTMKKVNEKMQQMKFFHKSQEHIEKEHAAATKDEKDEPALVNDDVSPTISRHSDYRQNHQAYSYNSEPEDIEEIINIQNEYASHRTRWTTNPLLNESIESDTDSEFPRVLIHQENSDLFESTLIIAVTRPASDSESSSPKITEIHSERVTPTIPVRPVEWLSNKEIISGFLEVTPPHTRKASTEAIVVTAGTTRGHARKLSMDSTNSDSDSWIPENIRNKQLNQSQESSRRASTAGLICIEENEKPWKVHSMFREEKLYKKTASIDIFEVDATQGGAMAAFENFDDELKNEPVVTIVGEHRDVDSFEKDSSEDPEVADDDNSSRITKILIETIKEEDKYVCPKIRVTDETHYAEESSEEDNRLRQIGNSRESLDANFDENEENEEIDSEDDEVDRPPSVSPPPPPLPERQPSIRLTRPQPTVPVISPMATPLPPLPSTKPPLPPHKPQLPPPKIPERTASMARLAKPLVKTSSLRLAYDEQVKPADVGKVNKLISRFEQPNSKVTERPRVIARRMYRSDSEEYSDEEEEEQSDEDRDSDVASEEDSKNANIQFERDITPTNQTPPPRKEAEFRDDTKTIQVVPIKCMTAPAIPVFSTSNMATKESISPTLMASTRHEENQSQIQCSTSYIKSPINIPKISINLDSNSNYSRPSSEYGSPLEYPSSLKGSAETTPIPGRRQQQQQLETHRAERSRRSMTRDNDNFYSFDSDEENSYYSISPSGSSRYVVEI